MPSTKTLMVRRAPRYFLPYLQNVEYTDPSTMSGEMKSQRIQAIELHVLGHAGKPRKYRAA